jgi:hypothetical protein
LFFFFLLSNIILEYFMEFMKWLSFLLFALLFELVNYIYVCSAVESIIYMSVRNDVKWCNLQEVVVCRRCKSQSTVCLPWPPFLCKNAQQRVYSHRRDVNCPIFWTYFPRIAWHLRKLSHWIGLKTVWSNVLCVHTCAMHFTKQFARRFITCQLLGCYSVWLL